MRPKQGGHAIGPKDDENSAAAAVDCRLRPTNWARVTSAIGIFDCLRTGGGDAYFAQDRFRQHRVRSARVHKRLDFPSVLALPGGYLYACLECSHAVIVHARNRQNGTSPFSPRPPAHR